MSLNDYIEKREEWIKSLSAGDPKTSIMPELVQLAFRSALIRIIATGIESSPKNEMGESMLNGLIWNTLTSQLAQAQALAIRRLVDTGKDVFSLYRLVNDVKAHAHLITRKNVLAADGFDSDLDEIKRKCAEFRAKQPNGVAFSVPDDINYNRAKERNELFDKVSVVAEADRSPDDTISVKLLENLLDELSKCENVKTFVNKYLAHSSTPENRRHLDPSQLVLTYGQLRDAEKLICQIAHFLQGLLASSTTIILPYFTGDPYLYIDQPLVNTTDIDKLKDAWSEYEKETKSWVNWDFSYLLGGT